MSLVGQRPNVDDSRRMTDSADAFGMAGDAFRQLTKAAAG